MKSLKDLIGFVQTLPESPKPNWHLIEEELTEQFSKQIIKVNLTIDAGMEEATAVEFVFADGTTQEFRIGWGGNQYEPDAYIDF